MTISLKILKLLTIIFLFGATLLLYLNLGRDYLYEWDESIYAELGRELTVTKLLSPTWNYDLWVEKPPLVAYLTAAGQHLVADPELGSRLYVPLATIATLTTVYLIGQALAGPVAGSVAVSLLAYFDLFISRSRSVNTDILLLFGISLAVLLLLKNAKPYLVALALTLAIFAKGPAGLLAIVIALPLFLTKSRSYLLTTIYYFLVFVLPWHLYQLLVNGSHFYTPYLLEQVLRRATVPIEFHLESRWFYFVHLYSDLGLGIITVSVLALIMSLKNRQYLLVWWATIPLILFTLAKTRLSWYILPVYPGLALLIGYLFSHLSTKLKAFERGVIVILIAGMYLQTLFKLTQSVEPTRHTTIYPDHVQVAASFQPYPGQSLAFLVSASERTAEAILPSDQRLSSSFRYGGAPSVVFYSQKNTTYYYNYDHFRSDLLQGKFDYVIVTVADQDKVPAGYTLLTKTDGYLGYQKAVPYANR